MNKYIPVIDNFSDFENNGDIILHLTKKFIKDAENNDFVNSQYFLTWEIEMNKLTVKDHNK